jgi:uncharacterized protein YceK
MKLTILLPCFLLSACVAACSKDDSAESAPADRTVMVYMAADNDLWGDALADLEEMQRGFTETGAKLVAFLDLPGEQPCIMEISPALAAKVHTYEEINSANPAQLRRVVSDMVAMYPAGRYGLVLWSHGASWLPAGVALNSFGDNAGAQMNIPALAEALPVHFDFILFDACLMGAVEVAYELKDKTDYLIASSTETIYEGFPYDEIAPELLKPDVSLTRVAQLYFGYYERQQGDYRSATVSVVSTAALAGLAYEMRQLVERFAPSEAFSRSDVQRLDVYGEQYHFDLLDFVRQAFPDADLTAFTA